MTMHSADRAILFVSSLETGDANHRLWFRAVADALGGAALSLHPAQLSDAVRGRHGDIDLVCSYKDEAAFLAINGLPATDRDRLVTGVIASDIYDLNHYLRWGDTPTFFLTPTPEHEYLLRCALNARIVTVEEPVDPLAGAPGDPANRPFDGWIHWFGYPESFDKGMRHLLPAIGDAVAGGEIRGLKVMTSPVLPNLPPWVHQIAYSDAALPRFLSDACFVVVSHFPYDLHMNSIIKTDNKALLSLALGAIPIASDTPGYGRVLRGAGLAQYLFDGPTTLRTMLATLSAQSPRLTENQTRLTRDLLRRRSALSTAAKVQNVFGAIRSSNAKSSR